MKLALAALFVAVVALFSTSASAADSQVGGFISHVERVQVDGGTAFKTTLKTPEGQVVWSGAGLVEAWTPMTLVIDNMVVHGSMATHEENTYRWDGSKFAPAMVAGFSVHVEARKVLDGQGNFQGTVFVTVLTFPGRESQAKVVSGIVQGIHDGFLTVDHVRIGADGNTGHDVVRLSMSHW